MLIEEEYDRIITTEYTNGQLNGQKTFIEDGFENRIQFYQDGLLVKETCFYDSNKIENSSEWIYPNLSIIDTCHYFIEAGIIECTYKHIRITEQPIRNGLWCYYYDNGNEIYKGVYENGKRVGNWIWKHSNGQTKVTANYYTNKWYHFDSIGTKVSSLKNEYLTLLTDEVWYTDKLTDTNTVTLYKQFNSTNYLNCNFYLKGNVTFGCWECDQVRGTFTLETNILSIRVSDNTNRFYNLKYEIESASDQKIVLKLLNK